MIDPNEILGFIDACQNSDYLKSLEYHIRLRLQALQGREEAQARLHQGGAMPGRKVSGPAPQEAPEPDKKAKAKRPVPRGVQE
jgi:hypothetical protein